MKKLLFISNITNRITNFSIPSINAAQELGWEFHMAANFSGFTDDAQQYNITFHHINLERNPLSLKNIKAYREMIKLLKHERFDAIHCNTPIGGILGRLCGRSEKVPKIIYTAHGFHFYKGAPFLNRIIFKGVEAWLAHYTDVIITINEEDYQSAKKFKIRDNGKVYYVPGVGVDTKLYNYNNINKEDLKSSLGIKKDDIILIAMGDLIYRKNYETSIKVIARLSNPNVHFLICGKGPELQKLKDIAKETGVENQIHFLGFRSDIKELLSIADIFLFTTYQEGLPRSMMEAMAAGLPCVASKIRGNTDLIENGKGGYLCDANNIFAFVEAINKILSSNKVRESMKVNNLETIKKFDVESVKIKIKEIYNKELE